MEAPRLLKNGASPDCIIVVVVVVVVCCVLCGVWCVVCGVWCVVCCCVVCCVLLLCCCVVVLLLCCCCVVVQVQLALPPTAPPSEYDVPQNVVGVRSKEILGTAITCTGSTRDAVTIFWSSSTTLSPICGTGASRI